ncbi:molybdopterin-guanine dinucleotide biosynthesis protein B [Halobacteriovorax sp. HLS]|uniref:molybdopterin-guanine dinucleotide biosynthesis protein B n=1 Tax=Halobacteriovorax sp. HLS TaxID=2234000 RepID=UPI0013E4012B|nr:molybdopterin-guanine dinucleotide biosynthesis protein B [Halobacteriovorax sp. HLS]
MTFKNNYLIHPFEICVCGYSGSGKTTLISKMITELSKSRRVGYIKHDAHRFEMDKEGKDTYIAKKSGAFQVSINSDTEFAFISNPIEDRFFLKNLYLDCDTVIIEGHKLSLLRKVFIYTGSDEDRALLQEYRSNESLSLLAVVGLSNDRPIEIGDLPYFHRDDLSGILNFLSNFFAEIIENTPVYGLVLGGGKSTRMGSDKGKLVYHGKSQVEYLYELLDSKLQKTYISCRDSQSEYDFNFETIKDKFLDYGPTGGLLSAFEFNSDVAWLVVACDMPFINDQTINDLLKRRNPFRLASCFHNDERKWPEPLCSIYEPKAKVRLGNYLLQGKPCPRKVLMNSHIELLTPLNKKSLNNINTPKEYQVALSELAGDSN